jgi:hypothetical protein
MINRMRRTVLLALGGLAGGGALVPLAASPARSGREIALLTAHLVADAWAKPSAPCGQVRGWS